MSEPKRATLSTISTQKSDVKKGKETSRTIRFSLTLPESNEKSCPEYNYRDLLNSAEKRNKAKEKPQHQPNGLNHLDPFDDDNDDDVKRIAQQFEEKYGMAKKKQRRGKKDDYADIGAGYDESDSFIDNTDAYDEMVPEDVTTLHGGFYINSGALEFKQVELSGSEGSESEEEVDKTVNRKRIIEASDDSDSEAEKEEPKIEHAEKKPKLDTNGVQKPAKKKLVMNEDKELQIKKKKMDEIAARKQKMITVKDLLREKRADLDMTLEPEVPEKDVPAKPSGSSTITDVIESVISAGRTVQPDETSKDSSSSEDIAAVSAHTSESESSRDGLPPPTAPSDQAQTESVKEPEVPMVKLPDNLPSNILEIINGIKRAAENSVGKVKFFSGPVNNMFLNLEIQCRKLGKPVRLQIFEHLAPFVKCKKDTLMRRAKNLFLDQERGKLKDPLRRLKVLVESIMPVVIKSYEKECQKVRDEMFLANANANLENSEVNSKVRRIPRKKFPWSEETRKTLQEIIFLKKKCFTLEGIRKETFEEHLETFLKTAVLPTWPEGWMTSTLLMKQAKITVDGLQKSKPPSQPPPMPPISLDVHATTVIPTPPFGHHSPVKSLSLSPCSTGISVIPIPQGAAPVSTSPKSAVNGPKHKHSPPVGAPVAASVKPGGDLCVTVNKKPEPPPPAAVNNAALISMSAEMCAVGSAKAGPATLLVPGGKTASNSVTITSVDLRTNHNNNNSTTNNNATSSKKDVHSSSKLPGEDVIKAAPPTEVHTKPAVPVPPSAASTGGAPSTSAVTANAAKPANLKQRILHDTQERAHGDANSEIIDLTDTPAIVRKPGPKSKTRYVENSVAPATSGKPKRMKEYIEQQSGHRPAKSSDEVAALRKAAEEITGTQALNQIITGMTKYHGAASAPDVSGASKVSYKENQASSAVNEDDMEQVMKDLKELQQLQEHARKNEIDLMAPSSSPVSVIAFNSNYSPTSRLQANDLSTQKERKQQQQQQQQQLSAADAQGFQDIFQKHLFQDVPLLKQSQSSSVYNANVQPKTNYNSINNFSYATTGSISNTINNIRYSQSSSKYTSPINHHLPTNPPGATNHTDDFALFQNFLYQYGFHNASGSKQKSPP